MLSISLCARVGLCAPASRSLFSDEPGVLSEALMNLLQPSNERQLRQYLGDKCPLTLPGISISESQRVGVLG